MLTLSFRAIALTTVIFAAACGTTKEAQKPVAVVQEKPKEAPAGDVSLAAAANLLKSGRAQEARTKYAAILQKDAGNFDAKLGLAACDLKLGDFDAAKQTLEALRKEKPEATEPVLLLGAMLTQKGEHGAAAALFRGQIERAEKQNIEPQPQVLNGFAAALRGAKEYDESEKACRRILAKDPENVDALKNLSLVYFEQEKYALAETIAVNSLKLNDNDAALYNNRGMIRVKRGRYPEAVSFFKKAVEIEPALVSAHLNLGAIALRYRDYNTAATHYGKVLALEPKQPDANLGYGFALSGQQKANEAVAQLQKALEVKPDAAEALGEIAMINKLQLNNVDAAREWCGKYRAARGAGADEKDPMKADCDQIDLEIKNRESAKAAMEKMKAQEEAEKAKEPPAAPPAPAAAAPAAPAPTPAASNPEPAKP